MTFYFYTTDDKCFRGTGIVGVFLVSAHLSAQTHLRDLRVKLQSEEAPPTFKKLIVAPPPDLWDQGLRNWFEIGLNNQLSGHICMFYPEKNFLKISVI